MDDTNNGNEKFIEPIETINNYSGAAVEIASMPAEAGPVVTANEVIGAAGELNEPNNVNEIAPNVDPVDELIGAVATVDEFIGAAGEHDTPNNINHRSQTIQNDFDPFRRLENIPFGLSGRRRAMSMDVELAQQMMIQPLIIPIQQRARRQPFIARLEPIVEEEFVLGDDVENSFR